MSAHPRSRFLLGCLFLAFALRCHAAPPQPRLDHLGDPLPAGAVARLGTARLDHRDCLIVCLRFSPNSRMIATAGTGTSIHLGDTSTGKRLSTLSLGEKHWSGGLSFSPDGRYLASHHPGEGIHIWDLVKGVRRWGIPWEGAAACLAWSPDGKMLAASGYLKGDRIRLWEVESGQPCRTLKGDQQYVASLAFTPDGRRLASGGVDRTILIWDLTITPPADLAPLWTALAGEVPLAHRALWRLVAASDRAVAFLSKRLKPAEPLRDPVVRQIKGWINDLDSDEFRVRRRAAEQLEKLVGKARPALVEALSRRPSVEAMRQVRRLLDRIDKHPLAPEEWQALRAVEALEHIGSPAAVRLLAALAKGAPDDRLTREAKASLARLGAAR